MSKESTRRSDTFFRENFREFFAASARYGKVANCWTKQHWSWTKNSSILVISKNEGPFFINNQKRKVLIISWSDYPVYLPPNLFWSFFQCEAGSADVFDVRLIFGKKYQDAAKVTISKGRWRVDKKEGENKNRSIYYYMTAGKHRTEESEKTEVELFGKFLAHFILWWSCNGELYKPHCEPGKNTAL